MEMNSETSLLIELTRSDGDLLQVDGDDVEWQLFTLLASKHQMDAYCGWLVERESHYGERLSRSLSNVLPRRVRAQLRQAYLYHMMRNEALRRNLLLMREAFQMEQVNPLYFKGPWLMLEAYPDPGTRPVSDIDVCIPEHEFTQASRALKNIGYGFLGTEPRTGTEAVKRAHYSEQLRYVGSGLRPVELHFRLVNMGPPGRDEQWVWETSRLLKIGDASILVPGPEAQILHLLIHANQHGFALLRLLHDVKYALRRDAAVLNWDRLRSAIRGVHCEALGYFAMKLASELAGADVESSFLADVRPNRFRRMMFARMWNLERVRRLEARPLPRALEAPVTYLMEMGTLSEKLVYAAGMLASLRPLHETLSGIRAVRR